MSTKPKPRSEADVETVLKRIERMVRRSDDFRLGFIKCNHPSQRKEMSAALIARLTDKRVLEIELDGPLVSLLDEITARWNAANPPDAVCIYGLEKSINEQHEASPVLGRLNNDRDLLRRSVPCALLIWLPDFALDLVVRGAPDFWAWRSGVYEFPTERASWQAASDAALDPDWSVLFSLSKDEKQKEIVRLEELLRTARALTHRGKGEQETVARILFQLGMLHYSLGELNTAWMQFEENIKILQRLGDTNDIVSALHQMGTIRKQQGILEESEQLYRQSLQIAEKSDDKRYIAYSIGQLGHILYLKDDFSGAMQLYDQSLQLSEQFGDKRGVIRVLLDMGDIHRDRGNLMEAAWLYKQSLEIGTALQDRHGVSRTLHKLGVVQQSQGNLTEAIQFYEQSLQMAESLGDKLGSAATSWRIGQLQQAQGQLRESLQNYVKTWTLFRELRFRDARLAQGSIQEVRDTIGEEQFQAWLTTDFGEQAREILAALEESEAASDG